MIAATNDRPWIDELCRAERLPGSYAATVSDYVAPLAERIRKLQVFLGHPVVIGINGAQGSGKTTFSLFLANWLERELGVASVTLSLDDLYLDKQSREDLAEQHHPLLRTRGVPGTHDIALGTKTLAALTDSGLDRTAKLPVFDKAIDDRLEESAWGSIVAPVDVVLLEGWCVGAQPQANESLNNPINALEAGEDIDSIWRTFVNEALRHDYADMFELLDALVMLRIPSFDKVIEWRELQEQKLRENADEKTLGEAAGMSPEEIRRFIMHFERLTRHMLEHLPSLADTVIDIDESHRMAAITHNDWAFERPPS